MPFSATSFVGRRRELETIQALFARGSRIVTLFGAGGSGKTRVAQRYAELFANTETLFCDLTEAPTAAAVAGVFARECVIDLPPTRDPQEALDHVARVLAARSAILVILDNAEHVVALVADVVARLAARAPQASFLVTSRELLRVAGEVAVEVGPLGLPDDGDPSESEAVRLFVDRARSVRPDYLLAEPDAPLVAALVRALDGLPLAIEIAAARTGVYRPADLLAHLGGELGADLGVLATRTRAGPDRHRTIRATIEWSWSLLSPAEQHVFARLAVFHGGFSLSAATAVVDLATAGDRLESVVDVVESLLQKSLVRRLEESEDGLRFGLFETIRAFGAERLMVQDPQGVTRTRFLDHFARVAAEACESRTPVAAIDRRLEPDVDNFLAAHEQLLRTTPPRPNEALTIALALERVLRARGAASSVARLVTAVEDTARSSVDAKLLARALVARAEAQSAMGGTRASRRDLDAALALAESSGDEWSEGRSLGALAFLDALEDAADPFTQGVAHARFERALAIHRRSQDVAGEAKTLVRFGYAAFLRRRLDRGIPLFEEAIAAAVRSGDPALEALAHRYLAYVRFMRGDLEESMASFDRAIEAGTRMGKAFRPELLAQDRAIVWQELGRWDEARALYEEAIVAQRRDASDARLGRTLAYAASLSHEAGDHETALRRYEQAIELLRSAPTSFPILSALVRAFRATLLANAGDLGQAERDLAEVLDGRPTDESLRECVRVCRGHLDLARGRAALAAGDVARATAHVAEARACLGGAETDRVVFDDVRLARRLLERALEAFPTHLVLVADDGAWFRVAGKDRTDLGHRKRLHPILRALAEVRARGADEALSTEALFRVAWAGERAPSATKANRVRVAIATLRELGLRDVLVNREGGYAFARDVTVTLVRTTSDP